MRLDSLNPALRTLATQTPQVKIEEPTNGGSDFGQMLMDAIKDVNKTQADSRALQSDFMAGRPVEYHDLMIAMEKSSTAMQLTVQVRNKLLEAYQEINRINV